LVASENLNIVDSARLFAMENLAGADAYIGGWNDKYYLQFLRPITPIREAATHGKPATEADPKWLPPFHPTTPVSQPPPPFNRPRPPPRPRFSRRHSPTPPRATVAGLVRSCKRSKPSSAQTRSLSPPLVTNPAPRGPLTASRTCSMKSSTRECGPAFTSAPLM